MCSVVEHASCKLLNQEWFLDDFAKFRKATISFVMSVLQSVSALTGWIFMKFDIFSDRNWIK